MKDMLNDMDDDLDAVLPDAAWLEVAINTGTLDDVKAWIAKFGIDTKITHAPPGAQWDATICGTPFVLAVLMRQEAIALWLLQNGASHALYRYSSDAGYSQDLTFHPLGLAMNQDMDSVVKLMLEQGVDFHAEQSIWYEDLDFPETEVFGDVFLRDGTTRPILERIGRLDLLESLAKEDFRTKQEKQCALDCAIA